MNVELKSKSTTGIIFNIVHGSFVDGPGVRTTVFLKGCPLRCLWCCNPEGQLAQIELKVISMNCNLCGNCVPVCPTNAITINPEVEDDKVHIDRKLCTNCGKCVDECFKGAVDYFGKVMTVDELYEILRKDEAYYKRSGGGVTIGGGEPTFQSEFTYALMKKLQESGIHVAIDTCGFTVNSQAFKILEEADLLLYDFKGVNFEEHIRNTGVSNELILANLKKLASMGKEIIIRMPLITNFNDSDENVQFAADLFSQYKSIKQVDIMVYHGYGTTKYKQLGRSYKLCGLPTNQERAKEVKRIFEQKGLNVQLGG